MSNPIQSTSLEQVDKQSSPVLVANKKRSRRRSRKAKIENDSITESLPDDESSLYQTEGLETDTATKSRSVNQDKALTSTLNSSASRSIKRSRASHDGHMSDSSEGSRKRMRSHLLSQNRRASLSKAARDPRDDYQNKATILRTENHKPESRSLSPVVDFDGLSRPSRFIVMIRW